MSTLELNNGAHRWSGLGPSGVPRLPLEARPQGRTGTFGQRAEANFVAFNFALAHALRPCLHTLAHLCQHAAATLVVAWGASSFFSFLAFVAHTRRSPLMLHAKAVLVLAHLNSKVAITSAVCI